MEYIRLSKGLADKFYKLIPATENIYDYIDHNRDYYSSIFRYNEKHFQHWKAQGSIAGITDVTTNCLVWDFDNKEDVNKAKEQAEILVKRLIDSDIDSSAIQISFSGAKGFAVVIEGTQQFTPSEFKTITAKVAEGLKYDESVSDASRLFRVPATKHPKSGLYKRPLTMDQFKTLSVDEIKGLAALPPDETVSNVINSWVPTEIPSSITYIPPKKDKVKQSGAIPEELDFSKKPKWLSETKYALQNGFFEGGERNEAMMILAATYRMQGFPKVVTHRMLKGVAELQAKRTNSEPFSSDEIWGNIVSVVYGNHWKGGTYGPNHPLLQRTREKYNLKDTSKDAMLPAHIHDIHPKFKNYVMNIDKNTIKTGIKSLDDAVFISTGANVGIVGAPGSGKSSIALDILSNTSRAGIKSVFISLDMARTRIYEKLLYRVSGKSRRDLYEIFQKHPIQEELLLNQIKEEYGNVYFYDKSASSVEEICAYIDACNELAVTPEDRVKLVVLDYFEMVSVDGNGDETSNSKKVAMQLQGIVNNYDVAQIVLTQPNKFSGSMEQPIKSYTNIKGSSFLAQSFRIVLGIYREGFDPQHPEDDKYLSVNVLKNDLGETAHLDFYWEGKRGKITEIDEEGLQHLKAIREANKSPEEL